MLAQVLLEAPRMFNHHRGLWGYTGTAADGGLLTIQATGMGGPSAVIVLEELIALGARQVIRVGTCGALVPGLDLGSLVVASEAICADGTSRALGAGPRSRADGAITRALEGAAPDARVGAVISVDLFYDADLGGVEDALAVEMEAAALFAVGAREGVAAGCVLVVTDTFDERGARERIEDHDLQQAAEAMGHAAVGALIDSGRT